MKPVRILIAFVLVLALFSSCAAAGDENASSVSFSLDYSASEEIEASKNDTKSDEKDIPDEEKYEYAPQKWGFELYEYPTPNFVSADVKEIKPDFSANFVLTKSGEVYAWGLNENGALGLGLPDNAMVLTPAKVEIKEEIAQLELSPGGNTAVCLGKDGGVYAWGCNTLAQIPETKDISVSSPVKLDLSGLGITPKLVSVSQTNLVICGEDGKIYMTAAPAENLDGFFDESSENSQVPSTSSLSYVGKIDNIVSVSAAYDHCVFLTKGGKVFIIGALAHYQFERFEEPKEIKFPKKIVKAAGIEDGLIALSESGKLYYMGHDRFGIEDERVDASDETYYSLEFNLIKEPKEIKKIGKKVTDFSSDASGIIVRTEDNEFYTWGYNLGHCCAETGDATIFRPTKLDLPENTKYIYMGNVSGTAITEDDKIYGWGSGYYCLYMGDTYLRTHTPQEIIFAG